VDTPIDQTDARVTAAAQRAEAASLAAKAATEANKTSNATLVAR